MNNKTELTRQQNEEDYEIKMNEIMGSDLHSG